MTIAAPATDERTHPPATKRHRVESVDLLRGAVMILMVLDHCREFFGDARDPSRLASPPASLFFTRWVTHLCAPTFSLLAGVSAALWGARRPRTELSLHLITRGFWLIVLEQTWENVFIFVQPQFLLGLVLWVLGWSMIVLAVLIYLPRPVIAAIAVATIAGHNLLDGVQPAPGPLSLLWSFLHAPGIQVLSGGIPILLGYPLIPWAGVIALGYAMSPLFSRPTALRWPVLLALGIGCLNGFVVLRWINVYGDPRPWSPGESTLQTAISFLNVTKQPPSLLFLLLTLGAAFLALAAFDRGLGRLGAPLEVFGRVPLFFYLMQWPLAHGLAVVFAALRGYPIGWMFGPDSLKSPPGYGDNLAVVYLGWIVTVALLYQPSRWYGERKRRHRTNPTAAIRPAPPDLVHDPSIG
jgi:uncharacterized membrane protein